MTFKYNVTGGERKRLVAVIGELLEIKPKYLGMPGCAFKVGAYTISRNGEVSFDDRTDSSEVEMLVEALMERGFEPEAAELPTAKKEEPTKQEEAPADDPDSLTICLPKKDLTDIAIENLRRLVASKEALIRKAIGSEDRLKIIVEDNRVCFPWFSRLENPEETETYSRFVGALCTMAKNASRVNAKEKAVDNEKYAFRCFLLRLGFIGEDAKTARRILLRNLSGSSAFKNGDPRAERNSESEVQA